MTYSRLCAQVEALWRDFHQCGLEPGERVAVVLPQSAELAVTFLAIAARGACAPLNPAYRGKEFDFYLEDLGAKAVVLQQGTDSPCREVARQRGLLVINLKPAVNTEAGTFSLRAAGGSVRAASQRRGAGDDAPGNAAETALVLHTSGTTSRPKMVPLTRANLCASARNMGTTLKLTEDDACLNVMPLFHIHGLMVTLASLFAGARVACPPAFAADGFFDWLQEFRPTWYSAVPTLHQAILAEAEQHADTIRRHPLRFVRSSSAALPPQVMQQLEKVFAAPVIEAYGMTEATHQMTSNPLPPAVRKPGSVGLAAGPEVAILDARGALLSGGQTGEIAVQGKNIMEGYENNPEANANAFSAGWFRTFNEETGVEHLRQNLLRLRRRVAQRHEVRLLFVDDASTDGTCESLRRGARRGTTNRERLGYVQGGYRRIIEQLRRKLEASGVQIRLGTAVTALARHRAGHPGAHGCSVQVVDADGGQSTLPYDQVFFTASSRLAKKIAAGELAAYVHDIESTYPASECYLGVLCLVLVLRAPLTPYYVLNIGDADIALTGVVEMTNLVDARAETCGRSLVYLPRYLDSQDHAFKASDETLFESFMEDGIQRLRPGFRRKDILEWRLHRAPLVQALPQATAQGEAASSVPELHRPLQLLGPYMLGCATLNNNEVVGLADAFLARHAGSF